jgi:hypothetical protein
MDFFFEKDISGTYVSESKSTWGKPCYIFTIDYKSHRWRGVSNDLFGEHRFPGFFSVPSQYSLKGNNLELQTELIDVGVGRSYFFKVGEACISSKEFGTLWMK